MTKDNKQHELSDSTDTAIAYSTCYVQCGDNLELLKSQPNESVNMIYCDILYGSVAVLPPLFDKSQSSGIIVAPGSPTGFLLNNQGTSSVVVNNTSTSPRIPALNSDLSALSIRATEYLQRWKEVVRFSSKDYSDQMAAQFGIKAPEYRSEERRGRERV